MEALLKTLTAVNDYMKKRGICGEVSYRGETSHLLRVANNQVSLNVSEQGAKFFVALQHKKRCINGSIATSPVNSQKIKELIKKQNLN